MRKAVGCGVLVVLLLLLVSPVPSEARGARVFFDIGIPVWVGPDPWGAAAWWGPPYYYPAPPPVIVQQPPVYAEPAPAQTPAYWYYCPNPQGYYPYIQHCSEGWMQVVPPAAPPAR